VPNAEETLAEFDWLAESESLTGFGRLISSRMRFTMPPPFFRDFFAAVDVAMMSVGQVPLIAALI
jgi:hypothetical protein